MSSTTSQPSKGQSTVTTVDNVALQVATVSDGGLLKRSGSTIVSVPAGGAGGGLPTPTAAGDVVESTDGSTWVKRTAAQFISDLALATLSAVATLISAALAAFAGTANIVTLGTVTSGTVPGVLIGVRVLTSGTSYSKTSGTKSIWVVALGGGGGGGGTTTSAAAAAVGAGGAAGGLVSKYYTGLGAGPFTYAIGSAGGAGSSSGGNGGGGGDTTFSDGTTTITAKGGQGGLGQSANTTFAFVDGGSGVIGTNGDVNGAGACGEGACRQNGLTAQSGGGGSTIYGGGGPGRSSNGTGNDGIGFGAGGGGGCVQNNSTAVAGGAGKAGIIVIYEYA